ncbi:hypothetical protein DYI95_009325 [Thermaerobacter sp. PB12/4term]|uniref:hypothetical protein n=1 Tax=Thermaerobacter sp. PB12/4term TaxID=2293838 RepID=UPI001313F1AC|nr:hypothetical protein [Thermaerobacter sp. PB12/4term]QIA27686.1 hypothetical protein DYI95_009325 [Thermaerobacter sp. PB12/4term]
MVKKRAHEAFLAEFIPMLDEPGTPEVRHARQVIEQTLTRLAEAACRRPEEAQ